MALLIVLLSGLGLVSAQKIKLSASNPAQGESVEFVQKITLSFDFSEIYEAYPEVPTEEILIRTDCAAASRAPKLYKGNGVTSGTAIATKKIPLTEYGNPGETFFSFSFDEPIELEAGEKYTLHVKKERLYAFYNNTKLGEVDTDIVIVVSGPHHEGLNLESSSPSPSTPLQQLDIFSLTFNGNVTIADNAKAYIYEGETEVAQSVSMSVNSNNAAVVDIDFGKVELYKTHNYTVKILEGSIFSASDNIGYAEINLSGYQGASYKYLTLGRPLPADNSEVSYLDDVTIDFRFPEGYNLGSHSKNCKAYLYKEGVADPLGEYTADYNNRATGLVVHINRYDLEPSSTYHVVLPEGQVIPGKIGETLSQYDLKDTSNPEVVLTYTTPATALVLPRVAGLACVREDDGSLKVIVPGYTFGEKSMPVFVVEDAERVSSRTEIQEGKYETVSWYISCPLYDTTGGIQTKIDDVEMLYKPNSLSDTEIWLVGKTLRTLYAGREYRLVVPAGTLAPRDMGTGINHLISNEESALALTGSADPLALAVAGGMPAGATMSHLGVIQFYAEGAASAADGAVARLIKDSTPVTDVAVAMVSATDNTLVIADFCDAAHSPLMLEDGASYTVVLPQGSLLGADGVLTNPETSVSFSGPLSVKESVCHNVTLSLDNAVAQTSAVEEGKTVSFVLTPADDLWKVESVSNATLDAESGKYVTEPVNADIEVKAVFALVNPVDFDFTEGVDATVAGCPYSVYSENGRLVIEGVAEGDNIRIYTTGGALMAERVVPSKADTVSIDLSTGIYIVAINGKTLKVKH